MPTKNLECIFIHYFFLKYEIAIVNGQGVTKSEPLTLETNWDISSMVRYVLYMYGIEYCNSNTIIIVVELILLVVVNGSSVIVVFKIKLFIKSEGKKLTVIAKEVSKLFLTVYEIKITLFLPSLPLLCVCCLCRF